MTASPLDEPLPAELTGAGHSWLTRYRRYPVFSRPWIRGRRRPFGLGLALLLVLVALGAFIHTGGGPVPYGVVAQLAIGLGLPVFVGPALCGWVRRQGWAPGREWLAMLLVLVATVLAMAAFREFGAEPLKQKLAELSGDVDAQGVRKKLVVAVGVTMGRPEDMATGAAKSPSWAASAASAGSAGMPTTASRQAVADHDSLAARGTGLAVNALLSFWLAGGIALWGWRNERAGLERLARVRELAQAQAQRREAELRLSVLAAQVEPHFLFNTLAGVRSAIATDPARASETIDRLVEYLRASIPRLRADGAVVSTLGGQIDSVRAYLGLMRARMPRLHFSIEVPEELLAARCPPLMLISLAENAVKHGVEPKIGPAQVRLHAERQEGDGEARLAVTVADDGVGFGGAALAGSGLGLVNIRERLSQLYGGRASLTLKARPGGGVAATLTVPLEWPDPAASSDANPVHARYPD